MKQSTSSNIAKVFAITSCSALSVLAVAPAQAIVMTFESLATNNFQLNNVGTTYTESGFTINGFEISEGGDVPTQLQVAGIRSSEYAGSTALSNPAIRGPIQLTQFGGGAFNLSSIDLTSIYTNSSVTVAFTGRRADDSTVSQFFTTDNPISTLQTFNFNNFTNLVSVDWSQGNNGSFHQFDNINVSAAGGTTAVPEPFTIIGTLVGGTAAFRLRKKLKLANK